jgi:hypothetical protein
MRPQIIVVYACYVVCWWMLWCIFVCTIITNIYDHQLSTYCLSIVCFLHLNISSVLNANSDREIATTLGIGQDPRPRSLFPLVHHFGLCFSVLRHSFYLHKQSSGKSFSWHMSWNDIQSSKITSCVNPTRQPFNRTSQMPGKIPLGLI